MSLAERYLRVLQDNLTTVVRDERRHLRKAADLVTAAVLTACSRATCW